jgi:diguanylate cyclase (GGDEF)-like protein
MSNQIRRESSPTLHDGGFRERDAGPFRHDGLHRRIGPFAVVALLAEASIALPPGPTSGTDTVISALLLFLTTVGCFLPWERLPTWSPVVVPLLYIGSVLALNLAAGGSTSGLGIVIFLPLVWASLYHRPSQSAVVVVAILAYELTTSFVPVELSGAILARRLIFWAAVASLVSFATHQLRAQIQSMLDQRQDLVDQRELALADMTISVSKLRERDRESTLLIELADALQTSSSVAEALAVIQSTSEQLFDGGALSIYSASRNLLETRVSWGPTSVTGQVFSKDDCWALRRGEVYFADEPSQACAHLAAWNSAHSICVPMVAQGETVGVFHVLTNRDVTSRPVIAQAWHDSSQLALAVGEHIGMSLANYRLRETLRNQSIRDPLTNLFNRRYMEETFLRELSRAARDQSEVSIMQIDIDYFKEFNDTYGHDVGDKLLQSFGALLSTLFRDSDVPCRFGGEEFTLILINSSLDETERRAEQLQRSLRDMKVSSDVHGKEGGTPPPTLSIGIASFPAHGQSAESLIRSADQAMYAAKAKGRNTIVRAPLVTSESV